MNQDSLGNTDVSRSDRLPYSQACENNKDPILKVLLNELQDYNHVLEIGSGTGQHSIYFAPRLPHLQWQTSDVIDNHRVIQEWHHRHPAPNLQAPLAFDLTTDDIPKPRISTVSSNSYSTYDAVFTANTLHIIAWHLVERLFQLAGNALPTNGKLIIYGPFNENGQYTSDSNRRFDQYLQQRDASSGIRNREDILSVAEQHHLILSKAYQMPANNKILIFKKV